MAAWPQDTNDLRTNPWQRPQRGFTEGDAQEDTQVANSQDANSQDVRELSAATLAQMLTVVVPLLAIAYAVTHYI